MRRARFAGLGIFAHDLQYLGQGRGVLSQSHATTANREQQYQDGPGKLEHVCKPPDLRWNAIWKGPKCNEWIKQKAIPRQPIRGQALSQAPAGRCWREC